jgi:hypothetical protein
MWLPFRSINGCIKQQCTLPGNLMYTKVAVCITASYSRTRLCISAWTLRLYRIANIVVPGSEWISEAAPQCFWRPKSAIVFLHFFSFELFHCFKI